MLKRLQGSGPFTLSVNGQATEKANGSVERAWSEIPRTFTPVCRLHNGQLERKFERRGRRVFKRAIDDLQPLHGPQVIDLTSWVCKTILIRSHPRSVNRVLTQVLGREPAKLEVPVSVLRQMLSSGRPPQDVSIWVTVIDRSLPHLNSTDIQRIALPAVIRADGSGGQCGVGGIGYGLGKQHASALFQLTFHPFIDLQHPAEALGLVTRLWPRPPATLDVAALPTVDANTAMQIERCFVPRNEFPVFVPPGERLIPGTALYEQATLLNLRIIF